MPLSSLRRASGRAAVSCAAAQPSRSFCATSGLARAAKSDCQDAAELDQRLRLGDLVGQPRLLLCQIEHPASGR